MLISECMFDIFCANIIRIDLKKEKKIEKK